MMSIYHLPFGQLSYGGHVINFPQDVSAFVSSLPRDPNNLDVIVVRRMGANQQTAHRDFCVHRSHVLEAKREQCLMNPSSLNYQKMVNCLAYQLLTHLLVRRGWKILIRLCQQKDTEQDTIEHSIDQRRHPHHNQHLPVMWPQLGNTSG